MKQKTDLARENKFREMTSILVSSSESSSYNQSQANQLFNQIQPLYQQQVYDQPDWIQLQQNKSSPKMFQDLRRKTKMISKEKSKPIQIGKSPLSNNFSSAINNNDYDCQLKKQVTKKRRKNRSGYSQKRRKTILKKKYKENKEKREITINKISAFLATDYQSLLKWMKLVQNSFNLLQCRVQQLLPPRPKRNCIQLNNFDNIRFNRGERIFRKLSPVQSIAKLRAIQYALADKIYEQKLEGLNLQFIFSWLIKFLKCPQEQKIALLKQNTSQNKQLTLNYQSNKRNILILIYNALLMIIKDKQHMNASRRKNQGTSVYVWFENFIKKHQFLSPNGSDKSKFAIEFDNSQQPAQDKKSRIQILGTDQNLNSKNVISMICQNENNDTLKQLQQVKKIEIQQGQKQLCIQQQLQQNQSCRLIKIGMDKQDQEKQHEIQQFEVQMGVQNQSKIQEQVLQRFPFLEKQERNQALKKRKQQLAEKYFKLSITTTSHAVLNTISAKSGSQDNTKNLSKTEDEFRIQTLKVKKAKCPVVTCRRQLSDGVCLNGNHLIVQCNKCHWTAHNCSSMVYSKQQFGQKISIIAKSEKIKLYHLPRIPKTLQKNNIQKVVQKCGYQYNTKQRIIPGTPNAFYCNYPVLSDSASQQIFLNREQQRYLPLQIKDSTIKQAGLGVFTTVDLNQPGALVCSYLGQIGVGSMTPVMRNYGLKDEQKNNSIFTLGWIGYDVLIIAPNLYSNVGRFINFNSEEKCNLKASLALIEDMKNEYEIVVFLTTTRPIKAGQQLFYSYGEDYKS